MHWNLYSNDTSWLEGMASVCINIIKCNYTPYCGITSPTAKFWKMPETAGVEEERGGSGQGAESRQVHNTLEAWDSLMKEDN